MRLARLDLVRYGRFTDEAIVFGDRPQGADLHIVYGPNEAGKSTALAAFLDLLFGIPMQSPFNFLHPYDTMQVGAVLTTAQGALALARVKRRDSLRDRDGRPIPKTVLTTLLGGMDRDAYQTMFCLDDGTIKKGSDGILQSKGDLGQLLFSASAGLADLGAELSKLTSEADSFYRRSARGGALVELNAELDRMKGERARVDTLAVSYGQLVEARDRAGRQYEGIVAEKGKLESRLREIARVLGALPRLAELRRVRAALDALGDVPQPPTEWSEQLPELQRADVETTTLLESLAQDIVSLTAARDDIDVDPAALALLGRLEGLDGLRARAALGDQDLPQRRIALRDAEREVTAILMRIGRADETDPNRLVIPAPVSGPLRRLLETRSGIDLALTAAQEEVRRADERCRAAQTRFVEAGGAANGVEAGRMTALAAILATARSDDRLSRLRLVRRDAERLALQLDARLAALKPWSGDAEALAALDGPDALRLDTWDAALTAADRQAEHCETALQRLDGETAALEARLAALSTRTEIVDDDEAARIRALREGAWATHRGRLDGDTADAFEAAMRRDDLVQSARLGTAETLAKLRADQQSLVLKRLERDEARHRAAEATRHRDAIESAIATAWHAIAGAHAPAGEALARLKAWLARREAALEAAAALGEATRERRAAEADAAALRDKLTAALQASCVSVAAGASDETLVDAAQTVIDREAGLAALHRQVADKTIELRERKHDLAAAEAAKAAWEAEWTAACGACWLGTTEATRQPAIVREILESIGELAAKLDVKAGYADRIAKMERDVQACSQEASELAATLAIDAAGRSPHDLARRVEARVRAVQAAASDRAAVESRLAKAQDRRRDLEATRKLDEARKARMTGFFGVNDLNAVAAKLRDAKERADLDLRTEQLAQDIVAATGRQTLEAAERMLDAVERPSLEQEQSMLTARLADLDMRRLESHAEREKANDRIAAVGGDDAVARIEEKRRTLLLTIADRAEHYLRLRIGTAAAECALRAYRNRHRSAMMEAASHAFAAISRGAYTGLTTQHERAGETLVALAADGRSKRADDLSKGTRFQLYLALRLAGYRELAKAREVVPFIADDILESFDDDRSEAAIRLLSDMSRIGQVIYFTHHRHICEIARRVAPNATMHDLGAVPGRPARRSDVA